MRFQYKRLSFGKLPKEAAWGLCFAALIFNTSLVQAASFTGYIGLSMGVDVSDDGTFMAAEGYPLVYRQDNLGNLIDLGEVDSPGFGASHVSSIGGMSSDGFVIAGNTTTFSSNNSRSQAFVWNVSGGISALGSTLVGESYATDVSGDGSRIAGWVLDNGQHAVIWSNGVETTRLDASTMASTISKNGLWLGGWSSGEAFVWSETGGLELIGAIGAGVTTTNGVSNDGNKAVGQAGDYTPFIWDRTTGIQSLGTLSMGDTGYATDISAGGTIVIGSFSNDGAFIWTEEDGLRNLQEVLVSDYGLDLTGWNLRGTGSISSDGTIITGYGFYQGNQASFVAVIPEPSTSMLLLLGGCGIWLLQRRRHGNGVLPAIKSYCLEVRP